jgi:hypothetical protein
MRDLIHQPFFCLWASSASLMFELAELRGSRVRNGRAPGTSRNSLQRPSRKAKT